MSALQDPKTFESLLGRLYAGEVANLLQEWLDYKTINDAIPQGVQ